MVKNEKSYLKFIAFAARITAASVAVIVLISCDGQNGRHQSENEYDPAGIYREYLSEIRKPDELPFEELAMQLKEWRTVRDSVFAHIRRDTIR